MSRNWIKMYPEEILFGSTFSELDFKQRYVWWGLLFYAGLGIPEDGYIGKCIGRGLSQKELADKLDCPLWLIKYSLPKLIEVNKIDIDNNNIIKIHNWNKYQSEYQRLKKYMVKDNREVNPEPKREPNPEPDNWKRNYAKGMQKERENEKLKEELQDEKVIIEQAKKCFKDYLDIGADCRGHHINADDKKPLLDKCKICLTMQPIFKSQLDKPAVVENYMQCSDMGNCHLKDIGGKPKYNFCQSKCAIDENIWKEQAYHWGNNIIQVKK